MFMVCSVSAFNMCMALVPIPHLSRYYIIQIIIHSKYFPDYDWLKAHV